MPATQALMETARKACPSVAFLRSIHQSIVEAEAEADRIAAAGNGADVMIYDIDDPNELRDWAVFR